VTIARYILKEHVGPFVFGLSLIVLIFTLNLLYQVLAKITGKGLPTSVIIEYFLNNLAWIMALAVPMSVLVATLSAFGRLSADGEITALRASGIKPTRLMIPVLWAALGLTLWVGWFNNNVLPEMNHRSRLLWGDISRKKPTFSIEPGIFNFSIPNYALLAMRVDQTNGRLEDVTIYDERNPQQRGIIAAKFGRLEFVPSNEAFQLTLFEGEIHRPSSLEPGGYERTTFDSSIFRIPAPGMILKRGDSEFRGDRELSAQEMLKQIKELTSRGDNIDARRVASLQVEVHKKMSIPLACMVFVLVGAPLGILAHKGGIGVSSGLSILGFLIYYIFITQGEILADREILTPGVAMWMPNIFFLGLGIFLWRYAQNHTSLPGVRKLGLWLRKLLYRDRLSHGSETRENT
jgi:lipopolysaccharide export system permease protein